MTFDDDILHPRNDNTSCCDLDNSTLDTTIDEWQAEMKRISPDAPGKTLSELATELKISKTTMRRRIEQLINEGRCMQNTGKRFDRFNRLYDVSVYQLYPREKKNDCNSWI